MICEGWFIFYFSIMFFNSLNNCRVFKSYLFGLGLKIVVILDWFERVRYFFEKFIKMMLCIMKLIFLDFFK